MYKAVIFDRDGTLNCTTRIQRVHDQKNAPTDGYVLSKDELELFPTVRSALSLLKERNIKCFVFTQQNCIGKNLVSKEAVDGIHHHMNTLLAPNASIEKFYVATHTDDPRAKPSPRMIQEILADHGYATSDVLVVGDSLRDCEAARAAGVAFAWVRDDLHRVDENTMHASGYPVFDDILGVINKIILKNI